jgi:hypothetical protein
MANKYKKNLKNYFSKIIFQKTNMSKKKIINGLGILHISFQIILTVFVY